MGPGFKIVVFFFIFFFYRGWRKSRPWPSARWMARRAPPLSFVTYDKILRGVTIIFLDDYRRSTCGRKRSAFCNADSGGWPTDDEKIEKKKKRRIASPNLDLIERNDFVRSRAGQRWIRIWAGMAGAIKKESYDLSMAGRLHRHSATSAFGLPTGDMWVAVVWPAGQKRFAAPGVGKKKRAGAGVFRLARPWTQGGWRFCENGRW